MKILGVDFETQGLDTKIALPTEVAAFLWEAGGDFIKEFESLIWDASYPPQPAEIVELTGITDEMLKADGREPRAVFLDLIALMLEADYVMAHNARFDREIFEASCARLGIPIPALQWICSRTEIPYPARYKCFKLAHLAVDHGMTINGADLHRASADVEILMDLVQTHYPLDMILAYRAIPNIIIRAMVPQPWTDGNAGKDKAKSNRFQWEEVDMGDYTKRRFDKCWVKKIKENELPAETERMAPYEVVVIPIEGMRAS